MNQRSSRSHQVLSEIVVGAFVLLIAAAMILFTIVLKQESLFGPSMPLKVSFTDAAGLRDGDNVVLKGVTIGTVREMELVDDGVHVTSMLNRQVRLREDYQITIAAMSVLGGSYMRIDEGSPTSPYLKLPEGELPRGEDPFDIAGEAGEMLRELRSALTNGNMLQNLSTVVDNLRVTTDSIRDGEGTIGRLVTESNLYVDLSATVENLRTVSDRLSQGSGVLGRMLAPDPQLESAFTNTVHALHTVMTGLEAGRGSLGKLLVEDQLHDDLAAASASLKTIAGRLERGDGSLGKLLVENELHDNLADAVKSLREIATRLEEGEGSIGQFLNDEDLYEQTKALVNDVRATIDDFRETTPIATFSSIFFGAL